jgi:hypothetical protein
MSHYTVEITIAMDSAAFDDAPMTELARILREYADKIERDGEPSKKLRDINGNVVGYATHSGRDVCIDAWAKWDVITQEWVLAETFDHSFCNECGSDTEIVKTTL